ncbi:cytochrome c oxidase subunit IV [Paenibacillus phyllosphaerae]|uniref:Cytochrome c oxidase subunit IV n=1 Tax=Paenibacillus phyllosphaerae TaxID=274593 RepID=A0A7W5FS22_9BACL|nr:DUF4173 domain-containing protein [Paenibacillus phyllosphaerae]MBB3114584.1 cytochrome c oxidase subunit IV [Paenibacillus phyllosphaerae]
MRDPAPWQKRYHRLLLLALTFGLFSQYMFVGHDAGISVLLVVGGFYGLLFYGVKGRIGGLDQWRGQTRSGWLLFVPISLLAISYAVFAGELFRALNAVILPLMLLSQAVLLTRSSKQPWYRPGFYEDVIHLGFIKPLTYMTVPFSLVSEWIAAKEGESSGRGSLRKISLGLVIASPVLVVVISLLASADSIFQSMLQSIPDLAGGLHAGEFVVRLLAALLIATYAFCYIWGLLFREPAAGSAFPSTVAGSPTTSGRPSLRLDPITAATLFISVNVVYLLFAAVQFTYLFGAADGLLPDGEAYAAYARKGFIELVLVAVINLALLLIGLHGVRREGKTVQLVIKTTLALIVGCTVVMLVSAYSRLALYEEAYGYTLTRLLVHGFMLFLAVLLVIAIVRVWWSRFSLAKAYICAAVIAYVLMNYANLDARIAANNAERYEATGIIDLDYLATRSADATPALADLAARYPELEQARAILADMRQEASRDRAWQSWNWSKWRAAES